MTKRLSLLYLAASSPLILVSLLVAAPVADVLFAVLVVAFPLALIVLGAEHRGGLGPELPPDPPQGGRLRAPLFVLLVYLEACVAAMLLLRGHVMEAPWVGGLPLATAIQVYGVFLLPMVFVALFYAFTFDRFGLRREDLDELRRRFRREDGGE